MFKLLIVSSLLATCFATPFFPLIPHSGRIVGGEDAALGDVPYQVIMFIDSSFACGGSIIRANVVMTAAHCVSSSFPPSAYTYRAGSVDMSSGGQVLGSASFVIHEDYVGSSTYWDSDIALFLMDGAFSFSDTVGLINLPKQDQYIPADSMALTSGWGRLWEGGPISSTLQKVNIPIVDQEVCKDRYTATGGRVSPNMICAGVLATGGKGPCNGDSGGPLVVDGEVVGITSWSAGCTRPGFPTVFARVPAFVDWIGKTIYKMEMRRLNQHVKPSDLFNTL